MSVAIHLAIASVANATPCNQSGDDGESNPARSEAIEESNAECGTKPTDDDTESGDAAGNRRRGRLADPEERARRVNELRQRADAAAERARAWAERTGSPMRIETNGTVMILVDYTEELGPVYRTTLAEDPE